jgi:hypothetical protein
MNIIFLCGNDGVQNVSAFRERQQKESANSSATAAACDIARFGGADRRDCNPLACLTKPPVRMDCDFAANPLGVPREIAAAIQPKTSRTRGGRHSLAE